MSLSPASPIDPSQTAGIQQQLNSAAAIQAISMEQANRTGPGGSVTWEGVGGPNPTQTSTLSPEMWRNFSLGNEMTRSMAQSGNYSTPQNFASLTSPYVQAQIDALQPLWTQQEHTLHSREQNQGLPQGGEAATNAERGQMSSEAQAIAANLPMFTQLAMSNYQMPIQTAGEMYSLAQGNQPQTPPIPQNANVQPADYQSAAIAAYNQQQQQFHDTISGIGSLGSAAVTGMFGLRNPGGGSWLVG